MKSFRVFYDCIYFHYEGTARRRITIPYSHDLDAKNDSEAERKAKALIRTQNKEDKGKAKNELRGISRIELIPLRGRKGRLEFCTLAVGDE